MWKVPFRYPSRISLYSRGGDGGEHPAAGLPGEGGGEDLHLPGGETFVHADGPQRTGGGMGEAGTRTMALYPPLAEEVVGDLQQLPGVALACM